MKKKIYGCMAALFLVACTGNESKVSGPVVKVQQVKGVPTFTIDDVPYLKPAFETYVPEQCYFEQFSLAGTDVYSFNTNVSSCDYGHSRPVQPEEGIFDFSGFDERMDHVLKADSTALVIPRINLGTASWWLEQHPEEMEVLDHGDIFYRQPNENPTVPQNRAFPSLASQKWREYIGDSLRQFLKHIQEHPVYRDHIFGYFIAGLDTEEWYHWSSGSSQLSGYSPHMRKAFQKWLMEKYKTEKALAKAWNRENLKISDVVVPSKSERYDIHQGMFRDPSEKMNVIDFYQFYNHIIPETIDYFAEIIKDETQGKKAVGAFYGYMYEFRGDPEYGHNALEEYNKSQNLDFIFVTASYENRIPGKGGDYSRAPAGSVRLHNKVWYHDNDVCSFLAPEVLKRAGFSDDSGWERNLTHHLAALGYTETAEKTRWMYRRSMGFALCNGAFESFFDLHGGYYDHPELMEEVRILNQVAEKASMQDRSSVADVLIVSDEASCSYATFRNQFLGESLLNFQHQIIKTGIASPDHILLCDLDAVDPGQYRLVIFLNCYNMDSATRKLIEEQYKKDGKTILWCYAPGYFNNEKCSVEMMNRLVGMDLEKMSGSQFVAPEIQLAANGYWQSEDGSQKMEGTVVGSKNQNCQAFVVSDDESQTLGYLQGTSHVAMAYREYDDWTSIYTLTPLLSPSVLRRIARNSGAHIYNEKDDTFYANKSFLCIHANQPGPRSITLVDSCQITDVIHNKVLSPCSDHIEVQMENGETLLLQYAD